MLRYYIYLIVLSTTIFGQNESEVPNLSVIRTLENYYCVLANDTLKSALIWNSETTDTTASITSLCNLYENDRCNLVTEQKLWTWINHTDLSPVLDYRWENKEDVEISFSLKIITHEVYIFLCDSYDNLYRYIFYGNCYWISIGAYNLTSSYIRKCKAGMLLQPGLYPEECAEIKDINNDSSIIEVNRWHHFTVSKQENVIQVRKYGRQKPILQYTDNSGNVIKPTFVLAKNPTGQGKDVYIKVHKVRALALEEEGMTASIYFGYNTISVGTCVSLYVKTCKECFFEINNQNTISNEKSDDWYEIFPITEMNINNNRVEITLKTILEPQHTVQIPYWFISDSIRKCKTDIATKRMENEHNNNGNDCCYALKYPTHKICTKNFNGSTPEDTGCPTNTIGKNCLTCEKFFDAESCKYSKICELSSNSLQCSCAAGYTGSKCSELNLPVLKKAPTITFTGRTNITLHASMDFEGQGQPNMFDIQYKKVQSQSWISSDKYPYEQNDQIRNISGLEANTKYVLRIILYVRKGQKYDKRLVPEVVFNTACGDITQEFLTHSVSMSSITLKVDDTNPLFGEICPLNNYKVYLNQAGVQTFYQILAVLNMFTQLEPYTEYTIEIKKTGVVLNFTIMTDEERPGQVVDARSTKFSGTSATLEWRTPQGPFSKIKEYRVQIEYIRSAICPDTIVEFYEIKSRYNIVKETNIMIANLSQYSIYEATIWAVAKYSGIEKTIQFKTSYADKLYETEFPEISVQECKTEYKVFATWNCINLKGFLGYQVELICLSEWCFHNRTSSVVVQVDQNSLKCVVKFNITGNTKYNMIQIILRNNQRLIKNISNFTTLPSTPSSVRYLTVYSKNETSFSLRWLPPYPPTGIIEAYYIYGYNVQEKIGATSICKLWPGKICTTVNTRHDGKYYSVQAQYLNVADRGPRQKTEVVYLEEEESEPPLKMSLEWDNDYGLIVQWYHPDKTNGNLIQFEVEVDGKKETPYKIDNEMPKYRKKVQISNYQTANKLSIGVAAINSAGSSQQLTDMIYSPPKRPMFLEDPVIPMVGNTYFNINIPIVSSVEGEKSYMYIVITNLNNTVEDRYKHIMEKKLFDEIEVKAENSWIVNEINLAEIQEEGLTFEVGNNVQNNSVDGWTFTNRKLQPGSSYNISIILNNTFKEYFRYKVYTLNCTLLASKPGTMNYLYILLLIPVFVYGIYYLYTRRCRQAKDKYYTVVRADRRSPETEVLSETSRSSSPTYCEILDVSPLTTDRPRDTINGYEEISFSKSFTVANLYNYVRKTIKYGKLKKQFESLPKGQIKPWVHGTMELNRSKNKFTNLPAYDHTRVKLDVINNDPHSDYINANYIDGYNSEKTYIAAQGPKPSTVDDFWRMIWQEEVEYIIMLANIIEDGKKKLEKYWPEIKCSKRFGSIVVEYVKVDVVATYEVRYFKVVCKNELREVQQFHFLNWPDGGVPLYFQSLVPFCKKFLNAPRGKSPVLVHSSMGIGRTGSFILCDICLHMAKVEKRIDVFYHARKLRIQRVNMVANFAQYKLVHLLLLQCLDALDMSIACNEKMVQRVQEVMAKDIRIQMKYLDDSVWQDQALRNTESKSVFAIDYHKNRFKDIIPDLISRVALTPSSPNDKLSTYINAVTVDAYFMVSKFIVTQNPLLSTVHDFWRMALEQNIGTIICLNKLDYSDESTTPFYPMTDIQIVEPLPYLEIKCVGKTSGEYFEVYSLAMTRLDQQEDDISIKLMQFKNWNYDMLHPRAPISLLKAYEEVYRLGRLCDKILIVCYDGARASGLFASLCFVMDMIKIEQICDVCLAVPTVRQSRKEFVRHEEQFSFLYECVLQFIRQYDKYSNYVPKKITNK